jgi:hypothetical protein
MTSRNALKLHFTISTPSYQHLEHSKLIYSRTRMLLMHITQCAQTALHYINTSYQYLEHSKLIYLRTRMLLMHITQCAQTALVFINTKLPASRTLQAHLFTQAHATHANHARRSNCTCLYQHQATSISNTPSSSIHAGACYSCKSRNALKLHFTISTLATSISNTSRMLLMQCARTALHRTNTTYQHLENPSNYIAHNALHLTDAFLRSNALAIFITPKHSSLDRHVKQSSFIPHTPPITLKADAHT